MGIEHLVHRRNEASLNLFYRYCFGRCSSELADLVPPLPNSGWASSRVFNILQDFSITVPRCYGDVCEQILSSQARLCNSLPAEYFSLAYDLNGFISRFNRHFFVFRFFLSKQLFLFSFIFFFLSLRQAGVIIWYLTNTLFPSIRSRSRLRSVL